MTAEPATTTAVNPATSPNIRTKIVFLKNFDITGRAYSDQTGKFLVPSTSGMKYLFVLYNYDSSLIWATPIPSRNKKHILKAYQDTIKLLESRGFKPVLQRMDKKCSNLLKEFMTSEGIEYKLTPAGKHGRNAAEKGIQIYKDHFIAGLSSTNPIFPLAHWDKLKLQGNITLNLLRPSRIHNIMSACNKNFCTFNYNKTPLAPPGMHVLAHLLPKDRQSFDPHAIKEAYSIGPAMNHYCCHRVLVQSTGKVCIADTVRWIPHGDLKMPISSKNDLRWNNCTDNRQQRLFPQSSRNGQQI